MIVTFDRGEGLATATTVSLFRTLAGSPAIVSSILGVATRAMKVSGAMTLASPTANGCVGDGTASRPG